MKSLCFVVVLFISLSYGQQTTTTVEAQSSGACSSNILSNQGRVEFTCNAPMVKATVNKVVSLLNQILQKQATGGSDKEINDKLDHILASLQNEAQAREPRHYSESQKNTLIGALSNTPGQVVNILRTARSNEIETLTEQFIEIFAKAGWRIGNNGLALSGLEKAVGLGVVVRSQEEHPKAADALLITLMNEGFKVEGGINAQVPVNEIRLVVAPKP